MALASVGAGAIYFLVIIVILNAYIDNKRRQKEPQLIRVIRDMKERMAMDEVHYLISDASRKVDVEAHVLRYWEEELELGIPRNEMGHRYYTDFHIRLFKQVKNLKEKGYQLKAIKHALEQMKKDGTDHVWEDLRTIPEAELKSHFPNIVEHCRQQGYDVTKECIPVVPAQHYFMGGIKVNLGSKTSMKGLYACGETSCNGVHGRNRLASNSLLESLVFAKRAAHKISGVKNAVNPVLFCKEAI